jgi:hypothetical protein
VQISSARDAVRQSYIQTPMGVKAEARFDFIQERAEFADDAALDV